MSTNCDYLSNVKSGRTDWRVKVRVIREWRGKNIGGQPVRGSICYYLMQRMQAFVPLFLMQKLQSMFITGRMYTITNFQVKDYTKADKWRCVSIDRQIQFTNQTKAKELDENQYFIAQNYFEFYDLGDMKNLVNQTTYLADVVGVVIRRGELMNKRNRNGQDQDQIRMTITDGSNTLNVTLWDDMASCFQSDISNTKFEEPLILIIAGGKVGIFQDEYDICNFSPTAYYINYNHHSVAQLRKMSTLQQFRVQPSRTILPKKEPKLLSVQQIKQLGEDYVEEAVICQVYITSVEVAEPWYYSQCTTCYKQVDEVDGKFKCQNCNNRIVPSPEKKFGIIVSAKDKTGDIDILLMDRPIRKLFGKNVFEMEEEEKGKFPSVLKTLQKGEYTIMLEIREFNVKDKEELFLATDIYQGFQMEELMSTAYSIQQPTEFSMAESSGTSIHLDNITQQ